MAVTATQPYTRSVLITKSDTVNFDGSTYSASAATKAIPCDAIYVGGAGIVVVVDQSGITSQWTAVAGQTIPFAAIRVNSTSSTSTLMNALYYV